MKVTFSTPHGDFKINRWRIDQTLKELCIQHRIPFQSVSFYGKKREELSLIIGLNIPLSNFVDVYENIIIKADRNIDYRKSTCKNIKIKSVPHPVSEYTFPDESGDALLHFELSQSDCQNYVISEVSQFLKNEVSIDPEKKIILGVSGGGDSNTLIMSFLKSDLIDPNQLIAVMMLGIPDWDRGQSRAEALCQEYGIALRIVTAETVNRLLGRSVEKDWVEDFEKVFPDADLEILGTHCIRLALTHVAKETGAQAVVTGLNLEDILAECLFATMQGKLPPPFPVRPVDGLPFWHPLYRIPKKIIDGCYPKLSLQNYNDRYPSHMPGRAIPYFISQSMHGIAPGIEFDLLNGFKKISKLNKPYGVFDSELKFSTLEPIPKELRSKWQQFIGCC
jgi:tRNA(Ile)-lysidine synthase TilS/MesJ